MFYSYHENVKTTKQGGPLLCFPINHSNSRRFASSQSYIKCSNVSVLFCGKVSVSVYCWLNILDNSLTSTATCSVFMYVLRVFDRSVHFLHDNNNNNNKRTFRYGTGHERIKDRQLLRSLSLWSYTAVRSNFHLLHVHVPCWIATFCCCCCCCCHA